MDFYIYNLETLERTTKVIIDEDDFEWINKYTWYAYPTKNYVCAKRFDSATQIFRNMHRDILHQNDPAIWVDHINLNSLDNRKSNLRLSNAKTNAYNRKGYSSKSIYKGIGPCRSGKFQARIVYNGKTIHLGTYDTEVQAAGAYNTKAQELFKDFALLNDVPNYPLKNIRKSIFSRGVSKSNNKYRAMIQINGKQIHIGVFNTIEEASLAYTSYSSVS